MAHYECLISSVESARVTSFPFFRVTYLLGKNEPRRVDKMQTPFRPMEWKELAELKKEKKKKKKTKELEEHSRGNVLVWTSLN